VTAPATRSLLEHRHQALEARFGLRVGALLSESPVGHDIEQRLRVARQQALERARQARLAAHPAAAPVVLGHGPAATLGGTPWWVRIASFAPLMVLALGLILIERLDVEEQIQAAAEIDAVLLADELPPKAYADPGFAEFLKQAGP
jgi:hypothetical protein